VVANYLASHPEADKKAVLKMISDRSKKPSGKIGGKRSP
jgi:hypothetical protein